MRVDTLWEAVDDVHDHPGTEQCFLIVQWSRAPYIRCPMCLFPLLSLLCTVRVSRSLAQMISRC